MKDIFDSNTLASLIDNPFYQFVDTRQDSYFYGYKDSVGVKGHIIGAIQFPVEWIDNISIEKRESFVSGKGILKNKAIIIYDAEVERSEKLYKFLVNELDYQHIFMFNNLSELFTSRPEFFRIFPGYKYIVSPLWLKDLIDGKKVDTYDKAEYAVYEVNSSLIDTMDDEKETAFDIYLNAHIPQAVYLNLYEMEDKDSLNISEHSIILEYLSSLGVSNDKTHILYSRNPSAAARAAFIMKWAGIEDIRLLNGSIQLWQKLGLPTESGKNNAKATDIKVANHFPDESMRIIDGNDAYQEQLKDNLKLISIRSWEEYSGRVGGYDKLPSIKDEMSAGEPYQAIWGFAGTRIKKMEDYYDPDLTYRNPQELEFLWSRQGFTSDDNVAFYCGTGWRACLPYFFTLVLGWKNSKLYDGSWIDWQKKDLPYLDRSKAETFYKPDNLNEYL